jgi:hypothetical protein
MQMAERTYASASAYRFGFDGQEADNEAHNDPNIYTADYWEYDSRLGRRWNRDPIVKPWESPYAAFSNNPIYYSDISGLNSDPGTGDDGGWWKFRKKGQKAFELKTVEAVYKRTFKDKFKFAMRKIGKAIMRVVKAAGDFLYNLIPNISTYGGNEKTASGNSTGGRKTGTYNPHAFWTIPIDMTELQQIMAAFGVIKNGDDDKNYGTKYSTNNNQRQNTVVDKKPVTGTETSEFKPGETVLRGGDGETVKQAVVKMKDAVMSLVSKEDFVLFASKGDLNVGSIVIFRKGDMIEVFEYRSEQGWTNTNSIPANNKEALKPYRSLIK